MYAVVRGSPEGESEQYEDEEPLVTEGEAGSSNKASMLPHKPEQRANKKWSNTKERKATRRKSRLASLGLTTTEVVHQIKQKV